MVTSPSSKDQFLPNLCRGVIAFGVILIAINLFAFFEPTTTKKPAQQYSCRSRCKSQLEVFSTLGFFPAQNPFAGRPEAKPAPCRVPRTPLA